ncbi:MAG: methylamine utilization protein MauE [Proteobacteria bacterium]|nr:MAG: methylamine utilization protein MauE [Pseudomonadota bacterium]
MLDPALEHVLRGSLALLLASGAVQKARDFALFRAAVEGYELLPARLAGVAAALFAALEGALGAALLAPARFGLRPGALALAAALFALYAAAIAINLARGRREIDCGCGGPAAHVPLSGWLLARNAILVAMALACLAGVAQRALGLVDALTIAGGVAALALIWTAVHGLLAHAAALARMQEDV